VIARRPELFQSMSFESLNLLALSPAPADSVSRVAFSPCGSMLLVASWSGELALHSPVHGAQSTAVKLPAPALDAAWSLDGSAVYAAALDGNVYSARLAQAALVAQGTVIGPHQKSASGIVVSADGAVISCSWDGTAHIRDPRDERSAPVSIVQVGAKVFSLCNVDEHAFAFTASDKRVRVVDCRKPSEFLHDISPSFGAALRTVDASPKRRVLVIGSTDGRIAVESMDGGTSPSYAFKCHRVDGRAYPVNALAHSRVYGSFASGGGDGTVNVWDGMARKRIYQYPCAATSIASIDFSPKDELMAVAVSYTFEEGERDHPEDTVYVLQVSDSEIRTRDAGVNKTTEISQGAQTAELQSLKAVTGPSSTYPQHLT
jgi:cell cycle arrest protein BUB3